MAQQQTRGQIVDAPLLVVLPDEMDDVSGIFPPRPGRRAACRPWRPPGRSAERGGHRAHPGSWSDGPAGKGRRRAPSSACPASSRGKQLFVRYFLAVANWRSSLVMASRKPSTISAGPAPSRGGTAYTWTCESLAAVGRRLDVPTARHRDAPRPAARRRTADTTHASPSRRPCGVLPPRSVPTARRSGPGLRSLPCRRSASPSRGRPPGHRCPAGQMPSDRRRGGRTGAPAGSGGPVARRLDRHGRRMLRRRDAARVVRVPGCAASPRAPAVSAIRAAARPPCAAASAGTANRRPARPTPAASRRAAGRPRPRSTARDRCRRWYGPGPGRPARSG